jgi:hypothetical protein
VTDQEAVAFNPDLSECCTAESFRIHLADVPASPWNTLAKWIFVDSFFEAHPDYEDHADNRAWVAQAFYTRLRSLRKDFINSLKTAQEQTKIKEDGAKEQRKRTVSIVSRPLLLNADWISLVVGTSLYSM